jgi:hypothetical protein
MIKTEEEYWNERFNEEERQIKFYYQDIGWQAIRPSTVYKPNLTIDGNMWCALYGDNLQEGVAGFGKSPALAYEDFDKNWYKELNTNE